jgi:hypothetical protein
MSAQEPTQIRPENNSWGETRWEQPRFDTTPNQPPVVQGQLVGIRQFQVAPWVWPVFLVAALITGNWGSMFVTTLVVAIVSGAVLKRMRRARHSTYLP